MDVFLQAKLFLKCLLIVKYFIWFLLSTFAFLTSSQISWIFSESIGGNYLAIQCEPLNPYFLMIWDHIYWPFLFLQILTLMSFMVLVSCNLIWDLAFLVYLRTCFSFHCFLICYCYYNHIDYFLIQFHQKEFVSVPKLHFLLFFSPE